MKLEDQVTSKKKVNRALCWECWNKHAVRWDYNPETHEHKAYLDGQEVVVYHCSPSTKRICEDCGEKTSGRKLQLFCKPEDAWWNRRERRIYENTDN